MIKTLSVRVKDKHAKVLRRMAFEVNQIFNKSNAITAELASVVSEFGPRKPTYPTAFDLDKLVKKESDYLIGSATVQEILSYHAKARKQFKRAKLRWRCSNGPKRSLGWIPFRVGQAKYKAGNIQFAKHHFKIWDSYGLSGYQFKSGSFSEDSRGRWYFNVCVEAEALAAAGTTMIGIDLGLKDIATCSNGAKLPAAKFYRNLQPELGKAQRARKKKRVRAIHAKIKNRRKDMIHKFTAGLARSHAAIFVGDVSSSKLAKTKMAKSILDAGWFMLKTQLKYKAIAHSGWFEEVDERYSTQLCSSCGEISVSSPKGMAGLGIREWTCACCGATHDRDINAAKNILAAGHRRLAVGITAL